MGRVTANMVRNFASQSILTGNSREALVKAIAQGAAEIAFLGTCGIIDGLMDGVEAPQGTDTPRPDSSTERSQEERLHDIFNSLHEDADPRAVPQTPPGEKDFLGKALPALQETLKDIFADLHAKVDCIGEGLQDLQESISKTAVDIYQGLRETGASVKIAWDEALQSTKYALKAGLENLLKTEPRLQSVVFPAVAAAAAGPALEALGVALAGLTALSYQHLQETSQESSWTPRSSRTFPEVSRSAPEGFQAYDGPQEHVESYPDQSAEKEDLPPYEPHPDDFAETRAKNRGQGGFQADPNVNKPKIFSTPQVDTDPKGNIFTKDEAEDKTWTKKGRLKEAQLPVTGQIRFIPRGDYRPNQPMRRGKKKGYLDKFGNEWTRGPSRTPGEAFEWDVQLSRQGKAKMGWASRDGKHVNVSLKGKITHD